MDNTMSTTSSEPEEVLEASGELFRCLHVPSYIFPPASAILSAPEVAVVTEEPVLVSYI